MRVSNSIKSIVITVVVLQFCGMSFGVTSKIIRQSSQADFEKGKTKNVIIDSRGRLSLSRATTTLAEKIEDSWVVNTMVSDGMGGLYLGTSPNGGIFKYSGGELTKLYPVETGEEACQADVNDVEGTEILEESEGTEIEAKEYFSNEHIFAMGVDKGGRILAGVSGENCRLMRYSGSGDFEVIFEPNDADYILAIAVDEAGNIYLGTGGEGKIYRLDAFGQNAEVFYDSSDNNILCLAIDEDGYVYAGSDTRGIVYKIDTRSGDAKVLFDSDQEEITSIVLSDEGYVYASATSAKLATKAGEFGNNMDDSPGAGKPETSSGEENSFSSGSTQLTIANSNVSQAEVVEKIKVVRGSPPGAASYIYQIDSKGFVTDVFKNTVILFSMESYDDMLLVGTGNKAQVFGVKPESEDSAVLFADEQASQITAVLADGDDIYLGTANPAKLIKLSEKLSEEGEYISSLIDAGQPAKWGKLQINADIPMDTQVLLSARSGNVNDINDPTFSQWSEEKELLGPTELDCPTGRFCQYRLTLKSAMGDESPLVREVASAYVILNLAPKVDSITAEVVKINGKMGAYKISYTSSDENSDKLIYRLDMRRVGRVGWIELKDELEVQDLLWDSKTVEDGRYEIRVTASDIRSNSEQTKLEGARVSDPVVVDNSSPEIAKYSIAVDGSDVKIALEAIDALSIIGSVEYTVDSNDKWVGSLPEDSVFDTKDESFEILLQGLSQGEHVVAVKVSDDMGNTLYRTFEVKIESEN